MKKKVAVLLAMAMAAGVLSGCGGSGGKETTAAATEAADAKETTAADRERNRKGRRGRKEAGFKRIPGCRAGFSGSGKGFGYVFYHRGIPDDRGPYSHPCG